MNDTWRAVPLRDLGKWTGGGTPSKANPTFWENGTIPWVSPKDMKCDRILSAEDSITETAVKQSTTNLVPVGSVLMVTRSGILRHTFPVAVTEVPVTLNQDLKSLTPTPGVLPKYVLFALKAFNRAILNTCSKQGTTVNSIETEKLLSFEIPLAPPDRQAEIVAEIEKQFSRLDETVTALKRIQANLKRYKAAVLKAAMEGKLTEQWRKEHPEVESADQLLKRILAERRAKWEAEELVKMKAKGIKPKDDSWKKKYKEPAGPDTANLPDLPEGLVWATIDQIAECLDSRRIPINKKERATRQGQIPYYGANGQVGWIDDYLFDEPLVLVVEDETFTGREIPFSYKITGKSWVNNHAHVLRNTGAVSIDFLNYALSFYPFTPLTTGTTGRKKLTQAALITAPLSLPPIEEQLEIVVEIDRRLSITEELESIIETNLKRAERLRQTILHQAFNG